MLLELVSMQIIGSSERLASFEDMEPRTRALETREATNPEHSGFSFPLADKQRPFSSEIKAPRREESENNFCKDKTIS